MPGSGKHNVNNIDSFFKVRPSRTTVREGETISFLENGNLVKQEKRNGVVYETVYVEQGTKKQEETSVSIASTSSAAGDITSVTAGTGLTGGGVSGPVTLNIDSTVTTLTGTQTLTNKTLTAPTLTGTTTATRINLGSTDTSSFLTGDPKISATGYMMIQGIVNETETGSAPAAIVFGNNSTYGNDEISLITNGQNRLYINSSGNITISQDLTITGDLQVNGTTTTVNQTNLDVSDNIIGLNRGVSNNTNDSGLIIERGSAGNNAAIIWDESEAKFTLGTTAAIPSDTGNLTIATGTLVASLEGNADTSTKWANPREISLTGDITGVTGASGLDGSADVSIATTIANNSVALGTQTTGNYMENVSAGTGISVSHTPSEGSTATISTNDSAIVHDNLNGYVDNEHIDWTTDQGDTNIHSGNYTDTNQLTTFTATDGGSQSVTIAQGKYWKFKNGAGVDVEFTDSNGGGSGDPFDLTFKLDLSTVNQLPQNVVSGDNFLVYNSTDGTALATLSEIQDALSIPSISGTNDGVVTKNPNDTLTAEANLTFDASSVLTATDGSESMAYTPSNNYLTIHETGATKGSHLRLATDNSDFILTAGGSANQLSLYDVNGTANRLVVNSSGTFHFQHHVTLQATKKLYLDGGIHTYIDEPSGDQLRLVAGGTEVLKGYSGGAIDMYGGSINRSINIGANRTADAASFIDLVGDTTYTDYGARLIRNSGANAITDLSHRGTGALRLRCQDAGAVLFMISDAEKMRVASSGNVGIGTQSPGANLHIYEAHTAVPELRIDNANHVMKLQANGTASVIDSTATNTLMVRASGSTKMTILNSGNVGIGTESPNTLLHLYSTSNTQMRLQSNNTGAQCNIIYQNGTASYSVGINSAEQFSFYSSQLGADAGFINTNGWLYWKNNILLTNNNTPLIGRDSGGTVRTMLKIDANDDLVIGDSNLNDVYINQNVGIGTNSPGEKLEISGGKLLVSGGQIRSGSYLEAFPSFSFANDTDTGMFSDTANQLEFSTGGSSRLTINSSGNVAINQGNKFYLDGVAASGDTYIQSDSADNLRFVVGNRNMIEMIENDTDPDQVVIGNGITDVDFIVEDDAGVAVLTVDSSTSKTTLHSLDVTNALTAGSFEVTTLKVANIQYTDGDAAITIANGGGVSLANGLTVDSGAVAFNGGLDMNENNISNVAHLGVDRIFGDADTDTQINFDGNDVMTFDTGNAEAMRINASQNVSIGNTSPDATLHIGDNSSSFTLGTTSGNSIDLLKLETKSTNANQLIFSSERIADGSTWTTTRERIYRRVDASNMGYIQFGSSFSASLADMISFGEVGVGDYMGITGDGKVGISTNSPTAKLQIGGGTDGKLFYTDGLYNDVTFNGGSGGTNGVWEFVNSGTWAQTRLYVQDANNVADRLTFDFRGNAGSNKILAGTSTGNVGIGVTNPDSPLHIANNVATSAGFDSFADYQILLYDTGTSTTSYGIGIRGNTFMFNSDVSYEWRVDNSAKMFLEYTGRLGIGTNSPGYNLDVSGTGRFTGHVDFDSTITIDSVLYGNQIDLTGELNFTGAGNKIIDVETLAGSNSLTIRHHNPSGNLFEDALKLTANAGAKLYYNNGLRFETTDAGATLTGSLTTEGPDGGGFIGNWSASSSFVAFGTANMSGGEYALLTNGTNTFLGSGNGGKTFFRGPANDSTPQLVNDGANIYMENAGNFGLGQVSPGYKLDVNGNGRFVSDLRCEGRYLSQDGSQSAPSYSFNSQGNAGMFRIGTGIGLSAGGSTIVQVNADGRVNYNSLTGVDHITIRSNGHTNSSGAASFYVKFCTVVVDNSPANYNGLSLSGTLYRGDNASGNTIDWSVWFNSALDNAQITHGGYMMSKGAVFIDNILVQRTAGDGEIDNGSCTYELYYDLSQSWTNNIYNIATEVHYASEGKYNVTWNSDNSEVTTLPGTQVVNVQTSTYDGTNQTKVPHGSASYPSYSFLGDINTGIYRQASDTMSFSMGGTEKFRFESDGDFHSKQDVIAYSTTPSDKKLKDNIKDIEYGLDTIMQLSPKEYDWKKDNRHDIGFIAQEVEEVIPEIVKNKEWFDDKIKTLDYEKLTAVLIKAVQEQQKQINKLEEKLNG